MIRPFELHRPTTVAEASALLVELPDAAVYRGGTELLQVMKLGFARFEHLIDLKRIPALHGVVRQADGSLWIGAATTHHEIERSPEVHAVSPVLADLERHVANRRVRSVGSLGGNLCFAEPHSDPATFLLAADARLELSGPSGSRSLGIDEFILGALTTALEPGELLVAVVLPPLAAGTNFGYRRLALAERPTASVACRLTIRDGVVSDVRLSVGAIGDMPVLAADVAARMTGVRLVELEEAARQATVGVGDSAEIPDEPGVSADYRRHLASVLARRAIGDAGAATRLAA